MSETTATKKQATLQMITNEVRRLDPNLESDSATFKTAVLLLSLATVGVSKVAAFTDYGSGFINPRIARLRQNGVLLRGGGIAANWFGRDGAVDFWMDVNVAEGLMERRR